MCASHDLYLPCKTAPILCSSWRVPVRASRKPIRARQPTSRGATIRWSSRDSCPNTKTTTILFETARGDDLAEKAACTGAVRFLYLYYWRQPDDMGTNATIIPSQTYQTKGATTQRRRRPKTSDNTLSAAAAAHLFAHGTPGGKHTFLFHNSRLRCLWFYELRALNVLQIHVRHRPF